MIYKFSTQTLIFAVLISLCLSGCALTLGPKETEEFHQSYQVDADTNIKIFNTNGAIQVTKGDKDLVEVYALKTTRHGRGELAKVEIKVTTNAEMVIKTEHIKKNAKVSVTYQIKVPVNVMVAYIGNSNGKIELEGTKVNATVTTSNGQIAIRNVDGSVKAATSNGKINILGTTGISEATTSNGSIEAEILNIEEDVNISTSNGSIELYVSPNLNANIEMRTSNGDIAIHDIQMVVSESASKHMQGKIGTGGNKLSVRTSNGDIDLFKSEVEK